MSVGSLKFAQCSALPGGCVASPSGAFFRGEPDERGRATRSFRSKRAETIAARPLDSTQATRAAHAAQSGCAVTGPHIAFRTSHLAHFLARRTSHGSTSHVLARRTSQSSGRSVMFASHGSTSHVVVWCARRMVARRTS